MTIQPAIPLEIALKLCSQIREENRAAWQSEEARWCWLCEYEHMDNRKAMGFRKLPNNRGCPQINARYARGTH